MLRSKLILMSVSRSCYHFFEITISPITKYLVWVIILFGSVISSSAANLTAANITRISHPAYTMSNVWMTKRSPWNVDKTRIMMYEAGTQDRDGVQQTHPDFPTARKLISTLRYLHEALINS